MTPDLRPLIETFTNDLSTLMRGAALEEVHLKLSVALGDAPPQRRGPGRPRKSAIPAAAPNATPVAAVPQRKKKGGKRTASDLAAFSDALLGHVKANPGTRGEQIAAAMGTDVGTMRLPMKKLVAARMIRTEGQKRGTQYFAGAGKAKPVRGARVGQRR